MFFSSSSSIICYGSMLTLDTMKFRLIETFPRPMNLCLLPLNMASERQVTEAPQSPMTSTPLIPISQLLTSTVAPERQATEALQSPVAAALHIPISQVQIRPVVGVKAREGKRKLAQALMSPYGWGCKRKRCFDKR